METYQSDVNDFARHRSYLHAASHPNAVFPDQEEVTDDRHNHVLKGDGDSRGDQAGKRGNRSDFGNESEDQDQGDRDPNNDASHQEKLVTATRVVNVTKDGSPPELTDD